MPMLPALSTSARLTVDPATAEAVAFDDEPPFVLLPPTAFDTWLPEIVNVVLSPWTAFTHDLASVTPATTPVLVNVQVTDVVGIVMLLLVTVTVDWSLSFLHASDGV